MPISSAFGSPSEIGRLFLTDQLLAFEITSVVLLVAAIVPPVIAVTRFGFFVSEPRYALPLYAGVRRWLLPALPEDPRRRRRRAYTTGGLSPLSRA